jgi:DNA mismatch endonuclease, patch repair protein
MAMSRSDLMSRIHSRGTKLEKRFVAAARDVGIRLFIPKAVYGRPDFCVLGSKFLVFVNSCFWHGCPTHCRMPATRQNYWKPKIEKNVIRQSLVTRRLRRKGYSVFIFWEHDFSNGMLRGKLTRLKSALKRR